MTFANTEAANKHPLSSTPPITRTSRLDDASGIEALFQRAECIQLSPGSFHGSATSVEFDAVRVFEYACNRGIYLRSSVTSNRLLIGLLKGASSIFERGHSWKADTLLAVTDEELDVSMLSESAIMWVEVRLDRLAPAEREALVHPRLSPVAPEEASALAEFRSYVERLLAPENVEFGTETDVLIRLSKALAFQRHPALGTKRQRRSFSLAQRVERFMWEHVEEPLTLERICANIGCRMRCLIYSFKDSFGLGPMTYLKIRRLNAAHRKLMAGRGESRIFDVAADFGFWHMGHFSADYKRMFGTTASHTLESARLAASGQAREFRG